MGDSRDIQLHDEHERKLCFDLCEAIATQVAISKIVKYISDKSGQAYMNEDDETAEVLRDLTHDISGKYMPTVCSAVLANHKAVREYVEKRDKHSIEEGLANWRPSLLRRWLLKHYFDHCLDKSEFPRLEQIEKIMTSNPLALLEPMIRDNPGLDMRIINEIREAMGL